MSVYAQQIRKYYDEGLELLEKKNYSEAIKKFTYAIKINPDYKDLFFQRATAYEKNGEYAKAADDYKTAAEKYKNKAFFYFQAGKMYYAAGDYYPAIEMLHVSTDLDKKNLEAYLLKIKAMLTLKNYDAALYECNQALKLKKNSLTYYYHGITAFYLKDFETAEEDLEKAVKLDITNHEAFAGLAELYYQIGKNDKAADMINRAIIIMPGRAEYYLLRSKIKVRKNDYAGAIADLSEILTHIDPDNPDILFVRAKYYEILRQPLNAINDYSAIIDNNPELIIALFYRARNYEQIEKQSLAVADYQRFLSLYNDTYQIYQKEVAEAKERIYQLNKESDKPVIKLVWPVPNASNILEIPNKKDTLWLTIEVYDQSELIYFKINQEKTDIPSDFGTRIIRKNISITNNKQLNLEAEDIYQNYSRVIYNVIQTETNPPTIHLISPYASDNGEIYLETTSSNIMIEGKITDESPIREIIIDNVLASYQKDEYNPVFRALISISNKDGITIKVKDKYGNQTEKSYYFNREGIRLLSSNPMGKTWVVFIENTDYEFLPPLKGPANDAQKLKEAFSSYQINNFLWKKNMSKADMQKFFMIELRDLIKENKVNSLMIWFAGHGKYINEMGYWMPVNAINNDEFTYFPVQSLKSSLQIYSPELKHILVITDACEAGPSFSMVIRADTQNPDCSDWTYASLRSAQVLTSTSGSWAADNSVFANAFAEALTTNPNTCISIDQISEFVIQAVKKSLKQTPVFGKIAGLEDEDGTFFFLKKE